MSDKLLILERVGFRQGRCISWERSYNHGATWQSVLWPYGEPPFTILDRSFVTGVVTWHGELDGLNPVDETLQRIMGAESDIKPTV